MSSGRYVDAAAPAPLRGGPRGASLVAAITAVLCVCGVLIGVDVVDQRSSPSAHGGPAPAAQGDAPAVDPVPPSSPQASAVATEPGPSADTVTVASDLPLQGASGPAGEETNDALRLYLDMIGHKAGRFTVTLKTYDDSTAAKGSWDDAACAENAREHVANADEVAVLGTYNSGCAKIELPVLNSDPAGPMLMVSHANTNPGLTKAWDPGEPGIYYPTGARNYARVIATDDTQGAAAASFLARQGARSVYVLNDGQLYGQGVARAFVRAAGAAGIRVLGNEQWDPSAPDYLTLFKMVKRTSPDAVFLSGIYDNNGHQLVKDKVAVLGHQSVVPLMAPDGFTGYPDLQQLPEGEGLYLSFTGLSMDQTLARGDTPRQFAAKYRAAYGKDPAFSFTFYAVAALQVIIAAITASDGTRSGVRNAVFDGPPIKIPADESETGAAVQIDPRTGDVVTKEVTISQLHDGRETLIGPVDAP